MVKWPAPIDHAYVLCSPTYEPDRYRNLKETFEKMGLDPSCYTFVYFKHWSELTPDDMFKAYNPWVERVPVKDEKKNYNRYNLKPSEISLCINWATFAVAALRDGHKTVLLFESDPVFKPDFLTKLDESLQKLPSTSWDYLSIGDGIGLKPQRAADDTELKWFASPGYYHTRTCVAQVFKVDILKKILTTYFPFAEALDWELNYQLTRHSAKSFWLDPILVENGSLLGAQPTTLI